MHMGNPLQSRVGRQGPAGPSFPSTESGDEIVVYATPQHWACGLAGKICVQIGPVAHEAKPTFLTPAEARQLAKALLGQANNAEVVL